ncbi:class I SAM-dependent methyltransferase [Virgibacillus sp. 179-BFC.A HS]|uniref:Class I SAM-dependent methyltransferase n=1 Tax=Tigheibacillus jepli TaxID=3035914 RepID=A0ABU5CCP3_9BACI|nr:class I SAM-dependent methyltransferase [Virgibacillus sp. 179-BFC.A HS]MDY0404091.1 class I SAM-dependent methyltransferase [Virgibacillus sp. 179-BFC.A HS]
MNWVKEFYEKQYQLLKRDGETSTITDYHKNLMLEIEELAGKPFQSMLELGAGGGEVAIVAAQKGYDVTTIELVPALVEHMEKQAQKYESAGSLHAICGDFLQVDVSAAFDVICYIDGFGVGEDQDQIQLLKRIANWLHPDGCALVDIYTPWYWAKHAGQMMRFESFQRKYDYDFEQARMLDTWFTESNTRYTQSLRCYAPADLKRLLARSGLRLAEIVPGGAMNYETGQYTENVSLGEAMSYRVKLVKN